MTAETLSARETTRTKNMAKRRETILREARSLIASEGFEALKIRDLAARAGLTVPTIYNLIGGKNEILAIIIDELVAQLRVIQDQAKRGSVEGSFATLINDLADHFATDEAFFRAAFIAGDRSGLFEQSSGEGIFAHFVQQPIEACARAVKEGLLRGQIPPEVLGPQIYGCYRLARQDWANGYFDLNEFRSQALIGVFLCLASDAEPAFRERLLTRIAGEAKTLRLRRAPRWIDVTDTGDRSQAASGEAAASGLDAGPVEGSNGAAGQKSGEAALRDGEPQPKKRRRRRRRRRKKTASDAAGATSKEQGSAQTDKTGPASPARQANPAAPKDPPVYAAIDLGTNNCRLLVAKRSREGFRVIDAYSRIVRLGEGLASTGQLSDAAMDRAAAALKICADKMHRRGVTNARSIATEACRTATNGAEFIARVKRETGIDLDIVSTADEAQLAVGGCAPLLDPDHAAALVFDIGGGSTELMWVHHEGRPKPEILDWTSLPCGVVTLAETYGGDAVSEELFAEMVADVSNRLEPFQERLARYDCADKPFHLLGTSGTVTTIAGVHLGLKRYDRARVDGAWVGLDDVSKVTETLLGMSLAERAAHACVGHERADLVLAGCAILEAIARSWPTDRLRVADRGLREGILFSLMEADQTRGQGGRRRRRRRRRRKSKTSQTSTPAGGEAQS
eukprot:s1_g579.t1